MKKTEMEPSSPLQSQMKEAGVPIMKYSDDQPRDEKGRFGSTNGTAAQQEVHTVLTEHGWQHTDSHETTDKNGKLPDSREYTHPDHPGHRIGVWYHGGWHHGVDRQGKWEGTGNSATSLATHLSGFHNK